MLNCFSCLKYVATPLLVQISSFWSSVFKFMKWTCSEPPYTPSGGHRSCYSGCSRRGEPRWCCASAAHDLIRTFSRRSRDHLRVCFNYTSDLTWPRTQNRGSLAELRDGWGLGLRESTGDTIQHLRGFVGQRFRCCTQTSRFAVTVSATPFSVTELQAGGCSPGMGRPVSKPARRGCSGAARKPWTDRPVADAWVMRALSYFKSEGSWLSACPALLMFAQTCLIPHVEREGKDWHEGLIC